MSLFIHTCSISEELNIILEQIISLEKCYLIFKLFTAPNTLDKYCWVFAHTKLEAKRNLYKFIGS